MHRLADLIDAKPAVSRREMLTERAPAKVNLTLRVLGRRADGYHELASLVVFAGTGDRVSLRPGPGLDLDMAGPHAGATGAAEDNLVLRAAAHLSARIPGLTLGRFSLVKHLPVAAGLGGGSSNAAAALRLLARSNGLAFDDPRLAEAALATGSDVPVCLSLRTSLMTGRGEGVTPLALPRCGAVLVNPRVPVPTADVFRGLALQPGDSHAGPVHPDVSEIARIAEGGGLSSMLASLPNDLESPARRLAPVLDEVSQALAATPGQRLVRMSGSGATMFALYADCRAAARAARIIAALHPGWWVKSTVLG